MIRCGYTQYSDPSESPTIRNAWFLGLPVVTCTHGPFQIGLVESHIKSKASESPMVNLIMRGPKKAKAYITKP